MPSTVRPTSAALRGLTGLALALTAAVLGAPAAHAHTVLQSTDPAAGATVAVVPETISLTFSEALLDVGTTIMVHASDERMVNIGPPVLVDNTVSQAVTGELPAGEYTVLYRVTSADGHPIEDQFRFTAAEATSYGVATPGPTMTESPSPSATPTSSAEVTPVPLPSPSESAPTAAAPGSSDSRVSGPVLIGVAAVLVTAGGLAAVLLLRRRGAAPGTSPAAPSAAVPDGPPGSSRQ